MGASRPEGSGPIGKNLLLLGFADGPAHAGAVGDIGEPVPRACAKGATQAIPRAARPYIVRTSAAGSPIGCPLLLDAGAEIVIAAAGVASLEGSKIRGRLIGWVVDRSRRR